MSETEKHIWSCNPNDLIPWTDEAKERLRVALAEIFNWKEEGDDDAKPL